MQAKLISLQRSSEIGLESKPSYGFLVHARIEHLKARASLLFRTVQREIRAAQQMLRVVIGLAVHRDPETHRRIRFVFSDSDRRLQRGLQTLGNARRVARLANVLEE